MLLNVVRKPNQGAKRRQRNTDASLRPLCGHERARAANRVHARQHIARDLRGSDRDDFKHRRNRRVTALRYYGLRQQSERDENGRASRHDKAVMVGAVWFMACRFYFRPVTLRIRPAGRSRGTHRIHLILL